MHVLFEKKERLLSKLQRKSENIITLIQIKLKVRTFNEEYNQCYDLLKLFLDIHYQYHSKPEASQQIEDGNWLDEVDQNIFTLKHLVHNYIQDNEGNRSRKSSKSSKVRTHQYQVGQEAQVPVLP